MPKARINDLKIHYELDGEGEETIVILNGIMMSTASWEDFVALYTKQNQCQLLRVDFRDQGLSDKYRQDYDLGIHVGDLKLLFKHLQLERVHLVGISYGAMVALLFALDYPDMLKSMVLSNAVARTTSYLESAGDLWQEAASLSDGARFFRIAMPLIYSDYFYNHNIDWLRARADLFADKLDREWFDALIRLDKSARNFDVMDQLEEITIPTMLLAGDRDRLTPVSEMVKMHKKLPDSRMMIIKDAGHASCYEKMDEFNTTVLGFIAVQQGL